MFSRRLSGKSFSSYIISRRDSSPSFPVTIPGSVLTEAVVSSPSTVARKGSQSAGPKGKSIAGKPTKSKTKTRKKACGSVALVSNTMLEDLSSGVTEDPAGLSVVGTGVTKSPPGISASSISVAQQVDCSNKSSRTEALQRSSDLIPDLGPSEGPRTAEHGMGVVRVVQDPVPVTSVARPVKVRKQNSRRLPSEKSPQQEHSLDLLSHL